MAKIEEAGALNKTNLNKIIKWSSSRYSEYRKADIIKKVLAMKHGDTFDCSTGSYVLGNSWGYGYKFRKAGKYLVVYYINGNIKILKEI